MMRNVWNLLLLITAVTAFAPTRPAVSRTTTVRHMFNPEPEKTSEPAAAPAAKPLEEASPLQEVAASESTSVEEITEEAPQAAFVRDKNVLYSDDTWWPR